MYITLISLCSFFLIRLVVVVMRVFGIIVSRWLIWIEGRGFFFERCGKRRRRRWR